MSNEPRTISCGGGPPDGKGMDRRLVVLEFENLRHEMMTMLKWVIALTISMLIAFCGTTFAMINASKAAPAARSAATAQPPPPSPAPGPLFR